MEYSDILNRVYERLLEADVKWKIDNKLQRPTFDDVDALLKSLIEQVRKHPGSISIEIGGVLVKNTDDDTDVYVKVGAVT